MNSLPGERCYPSPPPQAANQCSSLCSANDGNRLSAAIAKVSQHCVGWLWKDDVRSACSAFKDCRPRSGLFLSPPSLLFSCRVDLVKKEGHRLGNPFETQVSAGEEHKNKWTSTTPSNPVSCTHPPSWLRFCCAASVSPLSTWTSHGSQPVYGHVLARPMAPQRVGDLRLPSSRCWGPESSQKLPGHPQHPPGCVRRIRRIRIIQLPCALPS